MKNYNTNDAKNAILSVAKSYGVPMAQTIEKMMRLETAHFTSGQYRKTGSAGMEEGKWSNLPYAMDSIAMDDIHKPGLERFIVWPSVTDFAVYLAEYIKRHNGNWARWNSLNPLAQTEYTNRVNSIIPRFV